jgi:hypothetical protein
MSIALQGRYRRAIAGLTKLPVGTLGASEKHASECGLTLSVLLVIRCLAASVWFATVRTPSSRCNLVARQKDYIGDRHHRFGAALEEH